MLLSHLDLLRLGCLATSWACCDAEYKIFLRLRMSRLVFFEGIGCFPESEMPMADWWDGRLVLEPIRRCFGTTASWYSVPKLRWRVRRAERLGIL